MLTQFSQFLFNGAAVDSKSVGINSGLDCFVRDVTYI